MGERRKGKYRHFNTDGSYIDWIIEKDKYVMDYAGNGDDNLYIGTMLVPFICV